MINKIKRFIAVSLMGLWLISPVAVPVLISSTALAADNIGTSLCTGVGYAAGDGKGCGNEGTGSLKIAATKIINVFSIVVGVTAVIMIIYGGFRYITSGGDSNNIGGAKNTIIYAIIGLVIVALAQFIVRFVINTSTGATGSGS